MASCMATRPPRPSSRVRWTGSCVRAAGEQPVELVERRWCGRAGRSGEHLEVLLVRGRRRRGGAEQRTPGGGGRCGRAQAAVIGAGVGERALADAEDGGERGGQPL